MSAAIDEAVAEVGNPGDNGVVGGGDGGAGVGGASGGGEARASKRRKTVWSALPIARPSIA